MIRDIETVFDQDELGSLKEQVWWVGQSIVPFLVKATIHNKNLFIMITDLTRTWVVKKTSEVLWEEKDKYARTLQIRDVEGLLKLFESLLVNPEKKADYTFKTLDRTSILRFEVAKDIEVYPFLWKFNLQQKQRKVVQVFCSELLNPLIYTLNAQEKRIALLKRKFENMEKEYIKRLSESEKNMFKSQASESPEDWKIFMPQVNKEVLLDLKLDPSSRHFFLSMLREEKVKKNILPVSSNVQRINNIIQSEQRFEPDEVIRIEQLQQQERQNRQGQRKKMDFI